MAPCSLAIGEKAGAEAGPSHQWPLRGSVFDGAVTKLFEHPPEKEQLIDLGLLCGLGKQRHLAQLKREELLYLLSFKGVLLQVMHNRP